MAEKQRRVMVAMSGGLDSSAAAALLVAEGFEVVGVTLRMWEEDDTLLPGGPLSRCSRAGVEAAARAAHVLGIEHMVLDERRRFYSEVVEPFAREYLRGRTPNPCVECNRRVKFPAIIEAAGRVGAGCVATGHYARVQEDGEGGYSLLRAAGKEKDQSYALYGLGRDELSRTVFPNGGMSKEEVRRVASSRGLVAAKRESQEICFLRGGNYRDFLTLHFPEALSPGPVLDTSGRELGEHEGISFYTVGQRRWLGISAPHPLYVVALDPSRRAVIVGRGEEVPGVCLQAEDAHWIKGLPPGKDFEAEAMVRYNAAPVPCSVEAGEGGFELHFKDRVWALAPGQYAVLYRGDEVLGGGVITSAR